LRSFEGSPITRSFYSRYGDVVMDVVTPAPSAETHAGPRTRG
jgi:hypothetical protein